MTKWSRVLNLMWVYIHVSLQIRGIRIILIREYLSKFSEELITTLHAVCNIIYNGKTLIFSKFNFEIQLDLRVLWFCVAEYWEVTWVKVRCRDCRWAIWVRSLVHIFFLPKQLRLSRYSYLLCETLIYDIPISISKSIFWKDFWNFKNK